MKVSLLLHNAYGVGGTVRTVYNLAHALAGSCEVEIVSVLRRRKTPVFDIHPAVTLRSLLDLRPGHGDRDHELSRRASAIVPPDEEFARFYNALTDQRLEEFLSRTDADVVIGTRPAINLYVARFGKASSLRIAQEHMTQSLIPPKVRAEMTRHYDGLDASVTVTEADARALSETLRDNAERPHVLAIPNSVPAPLVEPSDRDNKIVVAAGRLEDLKRYDVLIRAFAIVADKRPDWRLRVYGDGPVLGGLKNLTELLNLGDRVAFMGQYSPIEAEWVKGSIAAVTSDLESFGMTIVEAMRCGLPVVSTDCPVGPREIIDEGVTGFLVDVGDSAAVADRLLRLIDDDGLRHRMGSQALALSGAYDPAVVAAQYTKLFSTLLEHKKARTQRQLSTSSLRTTVTSAPAVASAKSAAPVVRRPSVITAAGTALDPPSNVVRVLPRYFARSVELSMSRYGRRHLYKRTRHIVGSRLGEFLNHLDARWSRSASTTTVDDDGAVRVRLDVPRNVRKDFALECQLRGTTTRFTVDLESEPDTDGPLRRLTGVFPADARPAVDGVWDLYLRAVGGRRHRITAGTRDVRALLDPARQPGDEPFRWHIPYATQNDRLSIRSFQRERHAELDEIAVEGAGLVLRGRVFGVTPGPTPPRVVVRARHSDDIEVSYPGVWQTGRDFRCELALDRLVRVRLTRHDDFDVWLVADEGAEPIRMQRILSDIPWKKDMNRYPEVRVSEETDELLVREYPEPNLFVKPYFTPAEEFSIFVSDK
ncbi:glycosyltransferase family 4 protein [Stackebrandtia nassauensis]|uniref:Glycosyl transferase group 1 n=1 Tax=Stackebrandtia nassauensis (strain DSM 44728 / CIP 108903 / NRRL B-16338 / NBRC 102104 / LLR-40K-21) TaxID=446470 RepID=D3PXX5_STANL|nr:glycosyltransferase family 4 protein [Stackebrandtia nassauensis]ADD45304.1 glycosyl transferase group 1 [Stackebrandtia nassauensis DSM 44728]